MEPPKKSTKITKDWLEHIFTKYENKRQQGTTVKVNNFSIKKGTDPGDGFDSEIVLVDCQASVKNPDSSDKDFDTVYQVAVKFMGYDNFSRQMCIFSKNHLKSSLIYSEIIPELNELLAPFAPDEPKIYIPELMYSPRNGNEFTLVLENLKAKGYKINDKTKGLNYSCLVEAVNQIARLHAISYAYNESQNFLKKYPIFGRNPSLTYFLRPTAIFYLKNSVKFLKSLNREDLSKRLELSIPSLIEDYHSNRPMTGTVSCLNHGDYWTNNFMFSYQGSTPEGIKVIDWTDCFWGNPMYDLQSLIYTSTRRDLRQQHLEEILQHYHSAFTSITTKLGVDISGWTYTNFKKDWEETFILGFFFGLTSIQITLSKVIHSSDPQEESSILDHAACFPARAALNCLERGMAKVLITPAFYKLYMKRSMKMMMKDICREILSGTNEVMNSWLLDLLCEADEKGLFRTA